MEKETYSKIGKGNRRNFLKQFSAGGAGLALGSLGLTGCASNISQSRNTSTLRGAVKTGTSEVSFVANKDQREAAYQALKPIEQDVMSAIGEKQVIIKINSGQVAKDVWLNATDPNFVRGILDFLKPNYDQQVIIAESTAAGSTSTMVGFENYNFMPIRDEYNIKFVDLNDEPFTMKWILDNDRHPQAINILNPFLDPNVYMISATRLKSHNNVIATLAHKNIAMAAPVNHYKQASRRGRNEKPLMHAQVPRNSAREYDDSNRNLSYNLFLVGTMGVQADLAVLDGVVGMEGNGPVRGTPVEQGVALASTDWVAADRIGSELMGVDYSEMKYIQWCAEAGMGNDDLSQIKITGPDYKPHITKYQMHRNFEQQREWVHEDYS